MYKYDQSSGEFFHNDKKLWAGYSGYRNGKNNPALQAVRATGPIPVGLWHIGENYLSKNTGPLTIILTPDEKTETFGRSAFRIHGDSVKNPGTASRGCIILPRFVRQYIIDSPDKLLTVVK